MWRIFLTLLILASVALADTTAQASEQQGAHTKEQGSAPEGSHNDARKKAWAKLLEGRSYTCPEHLIGLVSSINLAREYSGDCELHMVCKPGVYGLDFLFLRDNREVLLLHGDAWSSFRLSGTRLYFAKHATDSGDCTILAYDLSTGKKLWETGLHHARPTDAQHDQPVRMPSSMRDSKRLALRMSWKNEVGDELSGSAVIVTGGDWYCDYVEVLDAETGKTLALKNYRVFAPPKPKNKASREQAWREVLSHRRFSFPENYSGLLTSLGRLTPKDRIDISYSPKKRWSFNLTFALRNCETLTLAGHSHSAFASFEDTLYFAAYGQDRSGCSVRAYDLNSGEQLWETELHFEKPGGHSAYGNRVIIRMSRAGEIQHGVEGGAVIITGQESYCDYVEVLDSETGGSLAVKNYRVGY